MYITWACFHNVSVGTHVILVHTKLLKYATISFWQDTENADHFLFQGMEKIWCLVFQRFTKVYFTGEEGR